MLTDHGQCLEEVSSLFEMLYDVKDNEFYNEEDLRDDDWDDDEIEKLERVIALG